MGGDPFAGFGGGGLGDIFDAFFGGAGGGAVARAGPARRAAPTSSWCSTSTSRRRCSAPSARSSCASPVPCETCDGQRRPARHARPPRARAAAAPARCAACASRSSARWSPPRPCPTLRRHGRGDRHAVPRLPGRGPAHRGADLPVDVPAGVDDGTTLRLPRPGRGRAPRRSARRPLRPPAGAAPRPLPARRATTCCTCSHAADDPGRARRPPAVRDARRRRGPRRSRRAPRRAGCSACGAGACPLLNGRGRGDLLVRVVVDTPTDLERRAGGAAAPARRASAARTWRPPTPGFFSKIRSRAFK